MSKGQTHRKPNRRIRRKNSPEKLRHDLAGRLPDMLTTAIASYEQITLPPEDADAKSYAALHGAAKAALAHIECLLKLAKWAASEENITDAQNGGLQQLIDAARTAVSNDENEGEPE